mmetsp:Transcript_27046/g.76389  ORF Transcript_27046/g.76389 Transcript_27046/m.76389 type:complete len:277 (+) Transcript_27046:302-1132(+)
MSSAPLALDASRMWATARSPRRPATLLPASTLCSSDLAIRPSPSRSKMQNVDHRIDSSMCAFRSRAASTSGATSIVAEAPAQPSSSESEASGGSGGAGTSGSPRLIACRPRCSSLTVRRPSASASSRLNTSQSTSMSSLSSWAAIASHAAPCSTLRLWRSRRRRIGLAPEPALHVPPPLCRLSLIQGSFSAWCALGRSAMDLRRSFWTRPLTPSDACAQHLLRKLGLARQTFSKTSRSSLPRKGSVPLASWCRITPALHRSQAWLWPPSTTTSGAM